MKTLKYDLNSCTFINGNWDLKGITGEANMITLSFIQASDFYIGKDNLKEWGRKVKE